MLKKQQFFIVLFAILGFGFSSDVRAEGEFGSANENLELGGDFKDQVARNKARKEAEEHEHQRVRDWGKKSFKDKLSNISLFRTRTAISEGAPEKTVSLSEALKFTFGDKGKAADAKMVASKRIDAARDAFRMENIEGADRKTLVKDRQAAREKSTQDAKDRDAQKKDESAKKEQVQKAQRAKLIEDTKNKINKLVTKAMDLKDQSVRSVNKYLDKISDNLTKNLDKISDWYNKKDTKENITAEQVDDNKAKTVAPKNVDVQKTKLTEAQRKQLVDNIDSSQEQFALDLVSKQIDAGKIIDPEEKKEYEQDRAKIIYVYKAVAVRLLDQFEKEPQHNLEEFSNKLKELRSLLEENFNKRFVLVNKFDEKNS